MTYGIEVHEPPEFIFRVHPSSVRNHTEVWREIAIAADQTLEQLGLYIIDAFDFDNDHLSSFFMSGKAWDTSTEYPMQDGGDDPISALFSASSGSVPSPWTPQRRPRAGEVRMGDLTLPGKTGRKGFLFLFDFGDQWEFSVRLIEKRATIDPHAIYPRVVAALGDPPEQYPYLDDSWVNGDPADELDDDGDGSDRSVVLTFPVNHR